MAAAATATARTNGITSHLNGITSDTDGIIAHANGTVVATPPKPTVVENFRPLRVIIIGAGFSGIYCGVRIPEKLRNIDLTIYEKNAGLGGTWYENRYPGCACDIPSHSYQYTFAPNPNWSDWYAPAAEIRQYLESIAKRYSVERFIKTSHKVTGATWDSQISKWHVTVNNLTTGEIIHDTADIVISARGSLNEMAWPNIPGVREMRIPVMHSAAWDDSVNFENKKIGVIGGGSSAIQIIPVLQRLPGVKLDCFIRSKTWISKPLGESAMALLGTQSTQFTQEEKDRFANNPEYYLKYRTTIERDGNSIHSVTMKDSQMQGDVRDAFTQLMKERLAKKPEIFETLLPSFGVTCRRLTPGLGYLEALVQDNVDFINTPIVKATPTGLVLKNGETRELDILVCATGFQTSAPPPFTVTGRNNTTMQEKFEPFPETYLSLATDGFPNYFMMMGPNAAIGTGPLTTMIEKTGDYIVKCIRKLQKENISSMEPKAARVKDFSKIIEKYFDKTVYLDECNSWYKKKTSKGDRIIGIWPGSALHAMETLRSPRWEDFDYTFEEDTDEESGNRLAWLGDGWSAPQVDEDAGDLAYFIQPGLLDIPTEPLPENNPTFRKLAFSH
uniref:FAD/NAD(P)-binding domain-containing protein n=1 Tax=Bionectria ochroleuca TaxID=29856 RepID=A0A8H7K9T6_BIOOC